MEHPWIVNENKTKGGELKDMKKNMQSYIKKEKTERQKNMEKLKEKKDK